MSTYRERREARAERLRGYAESRAKASDAAVEKVHQIGDSIPLGQPILVGHHSERRHRKAIQAIDDGMRSAVENGKMAERHSGRADNIEAQLATSIYSDDPDAIDALHAKVARLEAQRDDRKAANAAYRKEHGAELKAMTPYERSQAIPFPSYSLTNLGATIRTAKQRIEQITRTQEIVAAGGRGHGRVMTSRYGGECPDCGGSFDRGDQICWYGLVKVATHAVCPEAPRE